MFQRIFERKVDHLGRVVLPVDYRKRLNIQENDLLEFFIDEEEQTIILRKYDDNNLFDMGA